MSELSNKPVVAQPEVLHSSGLRSLDLIANGFNGLVMIVGPAGSGKTMLGLHFLKECYDLHGERSAVYVPTADSADKHLLRKIAPHGLKITPGKYSEPIFDSVAHLMYEDRAKVVFIDSLFFMTPMTNVNTLLGPSKVSQHVARSRMLQRGLGVLRRAATATGGLVLVSNSVRSNVGKSNLGKGYRHSSSGPYMLIAEMDAVVLLERTKTRAMYGRTHYSVVSAKMVKHRRPLRIGDSTDLLLWDTAGFDRAYNLLKTLVGLGVVERRGNYFYHKDFPVQLGPGWEAAAEYVERDFGLYVSLYDKHVDNFTIVGYKEQKEF